MKDKISNSKKKLYKETINKLLSDPVLAKYDDLTNGLRLIKRDLDSDEYRITIIGEFSTGKSTFLNALMGRDILPHGVEETTATVTYIHNVKTDSPNRNKVKVHFNNPNIKDIEFDIKDSSSKFIEFATAKSNRNVVEDIESVDVYLNFMGNEENVVLVDTPGLNGMAKGMREITLRELERSHANIFLFGTEGVKASDKDTIGSIYREDFTYFFIMNQIDRLIEEEPGKRIEKFREEIEKNITKGKKPKHVFGVSSLMALVAKDRSIKKLYSDSPDLIETDRINLLEKSNFIALENNLYKFISSGEKEIRFLDDVKGKLLNLLNRLKENLLFERGILQTKIQDIPSKNILNEQKTRVLSRVNDNKKIIRHKVIARLNELEKEEVRIKTSQCEAENEKWIKLINSWNSVEEVESWFNQNIIPNKVNNFYTKIRVETENSIKKGAQSIYSELIDLVASFVPQAKIKDGKVGFFDSSYIKNDKYSLFEYQSIIKRTQDKIDEKVRNLKKEKDDALMKINSAKSELQKENQKKVKIQVEYENAKSRLGAKPKYREWKETSYERKWYTLWIGKHKTVEWYDNQDDIDRWNEENKKIEGKKSKIKNIDNIIRQLSSKINLEEAQWRRRETQLNEQIEKLKKDKANEEQEIERLKKVARTTFISNAKKNLKEQLEKMVAPTLRDGGVLFLDLIDNIKSMIRQLEEEMQNNLDIIYDNLVAVFINNINLIDEQLNKKFNVSENNEKIRNLDKESHHINHIINESISRL